MAATAPGAQAPEGGRSAPREWVRALDPRAKLLVLVATSAAAFAATGAVELAGVVGAAVLWAVVAGLPARAGRRGARVVVALCAFALAVAAWTWWGGGALAEAAGPVARLLALLCAGWAFSASTPPGQLAVGLERLRLPRSVVLVAVSARTLLPVLTSEARMSYEAARLRLAEMGGLRARAAASVACRALVSLSLRVMQRADALAAAAELRAVGRPGARSSLREVRFRLRDAAVVVAAAAGLAAVWAG